MVHEITHILQGEARHSAEGIMKARWTPDDLAAMGVKPLTFTAEDVDLIYQGMDYREAHAKADSKTPIPEHHRSRSGNNGEISMAHGIPL